MQFAHNGSYKGSIPFGLNGFSAFTCGARSEPSMPCSAGAR